MLYNFLTVCMRDQLLVHLCCLSLSPPTHTPTCTHTHTHTHTHTPTQLGYGDLTPYGHPTSNTPHIQLLAEQGLVFTQFYTTSPICSPSRAALLTGRYQTRSGIYPGVFEPNDLGGKRKHCMRLPVCISSYNLLHTFRI